MTARMSRWLIALLILVWAGMSAYRRARFWASGSTPWRPFLGAWELEARWTRGRAAVGAEPVPPDPRRRIRRGGHFRSRRGRQGLPALSLDSWGGMSSGRHSPRGNSCTTAASHCEAVPRRAHRARVDLRDRLEHGRDGDSRADRESVPTANRRWQVWGRRGAEPDAWDPMMDGRWRRIAPNDLIVLPAPAGLDESLAALDPFLGSWEIASSRARRRTRSGRATNTGPVSTDCSSTRPPTLPRRRGRHLPRATRPSSSPIRRRIASTCSGSALTGRGAASRWSEVSGPQRTDPDSR